MSRGESYALDDVIREHIDWVLWLCDGNLSETARRLEIHRRTLQRMRRRKPRKRKLRASKIAKKTKKKRRGNTGF